jgi:hypothetical protein
MKRTLLPRGLVFLATAVAVHASLLFVRSRPDTHVPPPEEVTVIETDVSTGAPAPEDTARQAARASEIGKVDRVSPGVQRSAAATGRESERAQESSGEPSPAAPGVSEESGGWSLQPEAPMDVTSRSVIARAARTIVGAAPPSGESTTGGVAEALDAHDSAIGMGRGGPVISALENAAAGEDAPFDGAATFDVAIHTDGQISVALLDAVSASEEWSKVGEATRRALDPKRVRIPPGARGWHVVVRLEAKVQYPNGLDPAKLGTKVTVSPANGSSSEAPSPARASLAYVGKVCSVRLTLGLTLIPISGGCDPTNIGARPLRMVHGHVVKEGRL